MTTQERAHYHQLHPAKLLVDWGTAALAGALLWRWHPVAAIAVGFGPSLLVTLVFLSGRLDRALAAIQRRAAARATALRLSSDVNALRFVGLAVAWAACWLHLRWVIPAGVLVIVAAWWLAWRRGAADRRDE